MAHLDLDRQGLSAMLSPYLANGQATTPADRGLVAGEGPVKTFTIEAGQAGDPADLLARVAHPVGGDLVPTSDPQLFAVRGEHLTLFVDQLDPRFWLVHTVSTSTEARKTLRRWVWDNPSLDRCWFTQDFLGRLRADGISTWFKTDFRGAGYLPADGVSSRRLRVQMEGEEANDLLEQLRHDPRYAAASALTAVGLRIGDDPADIVEEIAGHDGSFIARGGTFDAHAGYAAAVIDRYRADVEAVEARHRLTWTAGANGGVRFDGDIATITLGRAITDLSLLLDGLFSCRDPFRLWGLPKIHHDNYATAEIVDLHIGEPFSMDIGPDYLRIFLSEAACGNTVLRLLTNLQRHYDATAALDSAAA